MTIPIGRYRSLSALNADDAATDASRLFERLGGTLLPWNGAGAERTEPDIKARLAEWAGRGRPRSSVLAWFGHGESTGDDAWLATHETGGGVTGIRPETVADYVVQEWRMRRSGPSAWAAIVIEACGAATFVRLLNRALAASPDCPERLILVGVGGRGSAHLGTFTSVLAGALASWEDCNQAEVPLREVWSQLEDRLKRSHDGTVFANDLSGAAPLVVRDAMGGRVTTTVDDYPRLRELVAALPADQRTHFIVKAQGAERGELSWFFTGRRRERREIVEWLRTTSAGLLVVTGPPGEGKSALLGNVLVYANRDLRELLVRTSRLDSPAEADTPAADAFDAVVHLAGMTTDDLVHRLAEAAGIDLDSERPGQAVERLMSELRTRPFTILADALDEAQEPAAVASSVLRRVAALPQGRVVVGTRRTGDLLHALGHAHDAATIEVTVDPGAVTDYVRLRLTAARGATPLEIDEPTIDAIAARVGKHSRNFLSARMAVYEVLSRPELLNPENGAELDRLAAAPHDTAFAAVIARLAADSPVARPVLHALAFARGRGLPRIDRIWAAMAAAIAERPVHEDDLDHVLAAAAPFIMLDREDGQAVFRLAHRVFQEHFVGPATAPAEPAHRAVTQALLDTARAHGPGELNSYLARRFPEHVATAGAWDELAAEPSTLDRLDPVSVARQALRVAFGQADLPSEIIGALGAVHLLPRTRPSDRALVRSIAAQRHGANASPPPPGSGVWGLAWTQLAIIPLAVTLDSDVQAVSALRMPGSDILVAAAGRAGAIRLWDAGTGEPVGEPLVGADDEAEQAVVVPLPDGRTLLVCHRRGGAADVWDVNTGRALLGTVRTANDPVVAPGADGRPIRLVATRAGAIRAWDLEDETESGPALFDYDWPQYPVAVVALPAGGCLLLARRTDGAIQLWDLDRRCRVGEAVPASPFGPHAAVGLGDGRSLRAEVVGGHLRVVEAATRTRPTSKVRAGELVRATTLPDGRRVAVLRGGRSALDRQEDRNTYATLDLDTGKTLEVLQPQHINDNAVPVVWNRAVKLLTVTRRGFRGRTRTENTDLAIPSPSYSDWSVVLLPASDGEDVVATFEMQMGERVSLWRLTPRGLRRRTIRAPWGGRVESVATVLRPGGQPGAFAVAYRHTMRPVRAKTGIDLWDARTGRRLKGSVRIRLGSRRSPKWIAHIPTTDDRIIIAGCWPGHWSEQTVWFWDARTGRPVDTGQFPPGWSLPEPTGSARELATPVSVLSTNDPSPRAVALMTRQDDRFQVHCNPADLMATNRPISMAGPVCALSSKDGSVFLAEAGSTGLILREATYGTIVHRLPLDLKVSSMVALGQRLVLATDAGLVALDLVEPPGWPAT